MQEEQNTLLSLQQDPERLIACQAEDRLNHIKNSRTRLNQMNEIQLTKYELGLSYLQDPSLHLHKAEIAMRKNQAMKRISPSEKLSNYMLAIGFRIQMVCYMIGSGFYCLSQILTISEWDILKFVLVSFVFVSFILSCGLYGDSLAKASFPKQSRKPPSKFHLQTQSLLKKTTQRYDKYFQGKELLNKMTFSQIEDLLTGLNLYWMNYSTGVLDVIAKLQIRRKQIMPLSIFQKRINEWAFLYLNSTVYYAIIGLSYSLSQINYDQIMLQKWFLIVALSLSGVYTVAVTFYLNYLKRSREFFFIPIQQTQEIEQEKAPLVEASLLSKTQDKKSEV